MLKRKREIDADAYAQVTVRLRDSVACSSVDCRVTKYRLLSEGDMNFFAGFLRFHPEQTVCEVNVEKSVHKQFVRYLRDMDVVGGDKLEGVAEMFNLYELSRRLRPFKCINCNTWIDPVAPRVHCLVRRVRDGRCLECGEVVCAHAHTLPWHVSDLLF